MTSKHNIDNNLLNVKNDLIVSFHYYSIVAWISMCLDPQLSNSPLQAQSYNKLRVHIF